MMNRGFTLIEILIAVAIVAVLIGFIVPNFLGIRIRARDTKRKSDLSQLQKAMELFRSDRDLPAYPDDTFMNGLCNKCWTQNADCGGNIYMKKLPCDPQTQNQYIYVRNPGDSLRYDISACLENQNDPDRDTESISQCDDQGMVSYTLTEP